MSTKQSQLGITRKSIIIVSLVVIVLGVIGFFIYQNFITPKVLVISDAKSLSITEWGVKGNYQSNDIPSYQVVTEPNHESLIFNFEDTEGLCDDKTDRIARYKGDDLLVYNSDDGLSQNSITVADYFNTYTTGDYIQFNHIGDYYYSYEFSTIDCTDPTNISLSLDTDTYIIAQKKVSNLVKEMFASLETN